MGYIAAKNDHKVLHRMVGIKEDDLPVIKWEAGNQFLDLCPISSDYREKLRIHRYFWAWWDRIWYIKDDQLINKLIDQIEISDNERALSIGKISYNSFFIYHVNVAHYPPQMLKGLVYSELKKAKS